MRASFSTTAWGRPAPDSPQDRLGILVLDGVSTNRFRAIVYRTQPDHPRVRLLNNPGQIVATGLNIGLREARGAIIVRVDGHTVIAPTYVAAYVSAKIRRRLARGRADVIGSPQVRGVRIAKLWLRSRSVGTRSRASLAPHQHTIARLNTRSSWSFSRQAA